MYAYHQYCYEARERMRQREREAQSERVMRQSRARRRRRARLVALQLLLGARRRVVGLRSVMSGTAKKHRLRAPGDICFRARRVPSTHVRGRRQWGR